MNAELLTILLFASLLLCMAVGFPIAFTLGGISTLFILLLLGPKAVYMMVASVYSDMNSFILVAMPMFILMANILQESGIADDLYTMMHAWIGRVRGGLAIGTVVICVIFAAMSGISATATVTMGLIALPAMLERGYDKRIAIGCISAGGALGVLIPPSIIMVIYGQISNVSVGKLFAGGVFPGLIIAALFISYILIRAGLQKELAPALPPEERPTLRESLLSIRAVVLPIFIVLMVLGSIFAGIATVTEAAAMGALGSIIAALVHRRLTWKKLDAAAIDTIKATGMVMWVMFAASIFSKLYMATGGPAFVQQLLQAVPGGRWGTMIGIQAIFFILGCLLDPVGIILITAPIFLPVIKSLGFDPLWFGIVFVVNMEMSFLTPPFGYNLFYMRAIVPKNVTMEDIYTSIIPYVGLQALGLVIVMAFPQTILWLPNQLIGR